MLTEKESFPIHFYIRFNAMLRILPVTLSRINGRIRLRVEHNRLKTVITKFIYLLMLLDSIFVGGRLIQLIRNRDKGEKRQDNFGERLILHFVFWTIANVSLITGWLTGFTHSTTNVTIFNSLYETEEQGQMKITGDVTDSDSVSQEGHKKPAKSDNGYERYLKPWNFSMVEIPSLYISIAALPCTFMLIGLALWDWERPNLIYSVLPTCFQNGYIFGLLLIPEAFLFNFGVAVICYPMVLQSLVFAKVDLELNRLKEMLNVVEKGGKDLKTIMTKVNQLSLLIHLLNGSHSYNIFTLKTLIMCPFPIFNTFQAIISFKKNPVMSLINLVFAVDSIFCFLEVYSRAFTLSDDFEGIRERILIISKKSQAADHETGGRNRNLNVHKNQAAGSRIVGYGANKAPNPIEKQLRSIPQMGVQVGRYSKMNKQSPLIYLEFITENICSLLIAYA